MTRWASGWGLSLGVVVFWCGGLLQAGLTDPEVDAYNIRIGTQTFRPRYHFTTNTVLVETADAIRGMGSDVLKFYMGRGFGSQYPGIRLGPGVTNLVSLATEDPSCRYVFASGFRHYLIWAYAFASTSDAWWSDGFSSEERQREYEEIYAFTRHLLTEHNGSGKTFYLGHWEGDWYLLPGYDATTNPTPTAIQGMIDWLNTRQSAVDDASRDTPHTAVAVYHYTEVNRVRDAMVNPPESNQRLVNRVVPHVANLDFVSWSSYDGMNLGEAELHATLDYVESQLSTNKAAVIPGRRVWIGEYGWGGVNSSEEQELPTRRYLQKLLPWSPRFILFWEMYDNEGKAFWLIDSDGRRTPCYELHQRFANLARLQLARFKETRQRMPDDSEFSALMTPALENPLPEPVSWVVDRQRLVALTNATATVQAYVGLGVYGEEAATVRVSWGSMDGGTNVGDWAHTQIAGTSGLFNPTAFRAVLTGIVPGEDVFFRFHASGSRGETWAAESVRFDVDGQRGRRNGGANRPAER